MAATTLHEQCPKCRGRCWISTPTIPAMPWREDERLPEVRIVKCPDCGGTGRVDSPEALARLAKLGKIERLAFALTIDPPALIYSRIVAILTGAE